MLKLKHILKKSLSECEEKYWYRLGWLINSQICQYSYCEWFISLPENRFNINNWLTIFSQVYGWILLYSFSRWSTTICLWKYWQVYRIFSGKHCIVPCYLHPPLSLKIEMMGFPIFNFTHPADQSKIRTSLQRKEPAEEAATSRSPVHLLASHQQTRDERGPRQSFYIRLREKPLAKQDPPQYEHMHVVGHLRRQVDTVEHNTFIGVMRPVRDR